MVKHNSSNYKKYNKYNYKNNKGKYPKIPYYIRERERREYRAMKEEQERYKRKNNPFYTLEKEVDLEERELQRKSTGRKLKLPGNKKYGQLTPGKPFVKSVRVGRRYRNPDITVFPGTGNQLEYNVPGYLKAAPLALAKAGYEILKTGLVSELFNQGIKEKYQLTHKNFADQSHHTKYLSKAKSEFIKGDIHWHDINISDNFSHYLLSQIAEGTSSGSRTGNTIQLKNLTVKLDVTPNSTVAQSAPRSSAIRILIFIDKQTNGLQCGLTDVLTTQEITSMRNMNNTSRFHIIHDQVHVINPGVRNFYNSSTQYVYGARKYIQINLCKLNTKITYSGSTSNYSDQKGNSLQIYILKVDPKVTVTGTTRLKWHDLN